MCDVCDVLESTYKPADIMVSTVYEYGDCSLGRGIRKLAGEMLTIGGIKSYQQGYNDGYQDAYSIALHQGLVKGSLITLAAFGTVSASIVLITKIHNHYQKKREIKNAKEIQSEQ